MNQQFLRNLVAYIDQTNRVIEKYASQNEKQTNMLQQHSIEKQQFNEKLAESIQALKKNGSILDSYADDLYNSLRDNPVKVAEALKQVDARPPQVGEAADGLTYKSDDMLDFLFS